MEMEISSNILISVLGRAAKFRCPLLNNKKTIQCPTDRNNQKTECKWKKEKYKTEHKSSHNRILIKKRKKKTYRSDRA